MPTNHRCMISTTFLISLSALLGCGTMPTLAVPPRSATFAKADLAQAKREVEAAESASTRSIYSWSVAGQETSGKGQEYCSDMEYGLRWKSGTRMTLGYILSFLGAGAVGTSTVLISNATEEKPLRGGKKSMAIAGPLVGAALLSGAYALFTSSSDAAESASKAASFASSNSISAMKGCNSVNVDWNGARAAAAQQAAEEAKSDADKLTEEQMSLVRQWLNERLSNQLGRPSSEPIVSAGEPGYQNVPGPAESAEGPSL